MGRDEIPDWTFEERTHYHLTINGKKCFFSYYDKSSCMLYVNGYMKPGYDVDNAIYDQDQYKRLFGMEPADLDSYIIKAIKNWEYKQKLSPNTRETFGDLIDEL
jgi:hypothetical protein